MKIIDFDSVVQNTKVSKSIIFIPGFFNALLHSRCSETTNMSYWFRCLLCYGQEDELNQLVVFCNSNNILITSGNYKTSVRFLKSTHCILILTKSSQKTAQEESAGPIFVTSEQGLDARKRASKPPRLKS